MRPGLDVFWEAFEELSTCRSFGLGGYAPIPWTAIAIYADRNGFDGDSFQDLVQIVRAMDDEWLKLMKEKADESRGVREEDGEPGEQGP